MESKKLQEVLGWCAAINFGLLIFSGFIFIFAHNWLYEIQYYFIPVSVETFDALWWLSLMLYKLLIFVFNFIPYFALRMVDNKSGIQQ
jgi:hypothetical protein